MPGPTERTCGPSAVQTLSPGKTRCELCEIALGNSNAALLYVKAAGHGMWSPTVDGIGHMTRVDKSIQAHGRRGMSGPKAVRAWFTIPVAYLGDRHAFMVLARDRHMSAGVIDYACGSTTLLDGSHHITSVA
jgi:hypothetical protein